MYVAVALPVPVAFAQPVAPSAETCHWYVVPVAGGWFAQVPGSQVKVCSARRVPEIVGAAVFASVPSVVVTACAEAGPASPPASATPLAASVRIWVPAGALAFARVTVYGPAPEPVTDETVQPVLVPVRAR